MKTLEYISNYILYLEKDLHYHKNLLVNIDLENVNDILLTIFYLEENISILNQIKDELLAWNSIKPRLINLGPIISIKFITKDNPSFTLIQKLIDKKND